MKVVNFLESRAAESTASNSQNFLTIEEREVPQIGTREVLIKVCAAGVNRADLLQRAGKYHPPAGASDLLGLEVSGIICAVGPEVVKFKIGDHVCALLAGGGYAQFVSIDQGLVIPKPKLVSLQHAAAIPEAFITAYTNLFVEGGLSQGKSVLIHGGSSGVGTAAIQLAKHCGAAIACTVGNERKAERCRMLGADLVINYRTSSFAQQVRAWRPEGVDLVIDIVGRDYLNDNLAILAEQGRIVCIAAISGSRGELNIAGLMTKRARLIGSVLRSRSLSEKSDLVSSFCRQYLSLFDSGVLTPIIDSVFPFEESEKAHEVMRQSQHIGKILLEWR